MPTATALGHGSKAPTIAAATAGSASETSPPSAVLVARRAAATAAGRTQRSSASSEEVSEATSDARRRHWLDENDASRITSTPRDKLARSGEHYIVGRLGDGGRVETVLELGRCVFPDVEPRLLLANLVRPEDRPSEQLAERLGQRALAGAGEPADHDEAYPALEQVAMARAR